MNTPARRSYLALAVLLLGGCASGPPVAFYALAPVTGSPAAASTGPSLQVAAVHIPGTLDHKDLVRRVSDTRVRLDDSNQWSAPLAGMIGRVLTRDLQSRLGADRVLPPAAPAPQDTQRIVLDILSFMPQADDTVVLDGSWSLLRTGQPTVTRHLHASAPLRASGDQQQGKPPATRAAAEQTRAMSAILGRVADHMAAALARGD